MKRLLSILLLVMFVPLYSFSISLNDIENNPSRYIKQNSPTRTSPNVGYIDIESINAYSDFSSYKIIEYTSYIVNYNRIEIYDYKNTVVFDDRFSTFSESKTTASEYGIYLRIANGFGYDFSGTPLTYKMNSIMYDVRMDSLLIKEILYAHKHYYHHDYIKKF